MMTIDNSPHTASRPVMCLGDKWQTYHVSSQRRDTETSCPTTDQRHAAVVCQSCCIHVDQEDPVMTSLADLVTSLTGSTRGMYRRTLSTATWRTSDHRLTLARYCSPSRRRTVVDHGCRRRCLWDLPFLGCEYHRVNWVCRHSMSWW